MERSEPMQTLHAYIPPKDVAAGDKHVNITFQV